MFVGDCLRPFRQVPPGRSGGGEFDHQPEDEQLQADRLVPGVEVDRQLARLYCVRDSCGERFLQPLRGVIGGGKFGYHTVQGQQSERLASL